MLPFITNPHYKNSAELSSAEIAHGIELASEVIRLFHADATKELNNIAALIGVGNEAAGKAYSLLGTKFCIKISVLGKHVGKNQELQFKLNDECRKAIANRKGNKKVKIEGSEYSLECSPAVAVATDDTHAYTLMIRHDNTIRLWDEENIPFTDKDNWPVIDRIKAIMRRYGRKEFLKSMDVNGNNILVDLNNKVLYLIDPYVPE